MIGRFKFFPHSTQNFAIIAFAAVATASFNKSLSSCYGGFFAPEMGMA